MGNQIDSVRRTLNADQNDCLGSPAPLQLAVANCTFWIREQQFRL